MCTDRVTALYKKGAGLSTIRHVTLDQRAQGESLQTTWTPTRTQPVSSHAVHASACAPRTQLDWTKLAHHLQASTCQSIPQHACATLDSRHPHVCSWKRTWQQFPHCNCRIHMMCWQHCMLNQKAAVLCIKLGSVEHFNGKQQNIQRSTPLYSVGAAHARTWHCKDCQSGFALHHADGVA